MLSHCPPFLRGNLTFWVIALLTIGILLYIFCITHVPPFKHIINISQFQYIITGEFLMKIIILILLTACFINCSGNENFKKSTIDGVTIINNLYPKYQDKPQISLTYNSTIESEDKEDDNYLLFGVSDIEFDEEDNIYVMDHGNYRIQVFDKNGIYIRTVGKKGQGPGELGRSSYISVSNTNDLYVLNGRKKLDKFDPKGNYVSSLNLDTGRMFGFTRLKSGKMLYSSEAFNISGPITEENKKLNNLINVISEDGKAINDFVAPRNFNNSHINFEANMIKYTTDEDENIYVSYTFQNKIEKFSLKGKKLFEINFNTNYPTHDFELNERGTIKTFASFYSRDIEVDDKGRIWSLGFSKDITFDDWKNGEGIYYFHVFDKDGVFLQSVPVEESVIIFSIHKNKLYTVDVEGVYIKSYNIK